MDINAIGDALKKIKLQGVGDLLHLCLGLEEYLQRIEDIFAGMAETSELVIKYRPVAVDLMAKTKSLDEKISKLIDDVKVESDTSDPSPLTTAILYAEYATLVSSLSTEVEELVDNVNKYL